MKEIEMCLQNFKFKSYDCNWPGCKNRAVESINCPEVLVSRTCHCLKHHLRKRSGRVGRQWARDFYREHLKPVCSLTDIRWRDQYKTTKKMAERMGIELSRYELIRRTSQAFDVDHIDGNHYNNDPSNLQTLIKFAHKFKTDVSGDANGWKYY